MEYLELIDIFNFRYFRQSGHLYEENMSGKLIILSAPSGAGKSTIIQYLLKQDLRLVFSISATSRSRRTGETDKKDYFFLSVDEFKKKIENNKFLEWEEVYHNTYYGTLRNEVDRITKKGNNVIFDVDIEGGLNIKKVYGKDAIAIFIMPPSVEELRKRLIARSDGTENIEERVKKAEMELTHKDSFDIVLVNDKLEDAFKQATEIVSNFLDII